MYKLKPHHDCDMPADHKLNILALNGSLKHKPDISNTEEVVVDVMRNMGTKCEISSEIVRLSDCDLPVGLGFRESDTDERIRPQKRWRKIWHATLCTMHSF